MSRNTFSDRAHSHRRPCSNRVRLMLLRRGLSYAEVARRLGVSHRSTIARVVYGHYILPEVRDGIAGLLGVPTERLWPNDRAA
ncbi:MAG: helix-turn-helix transcriptional regulator [Nitrospira sp.]|nr:helix-turn-helix transcriptional regulator [Nitrospira sp.]